MENIVINQDDIKEVIQSTKITFLINTLISFFNTLIIQDTEFLVQFLAAQSIGLTIVSIILIANILFPIFKSKFIYQYFFMPFPVLISTLIGLNFLHQYTSFYELYGLVFVMTLLALLIFQYRNKNKLTHQSLEQQKQKQVQTERALLESKLLLLQAQINPHFLFNTLANIDAYIEDFPDKAKLLLQDYTQFLRQSLKITQQKMGTIGDEVTLIDAYMAIHRTRFPNVNFNKNVNDSLLEKKLPPLIIQPLIENALIHGLAPQGNQGTITLDINESQKILTIIITDDGIGLSNSQSKKQSNGIALNNIKSRLQLHSTHSSLILTEPESGGSCATIKIPL